MTGSIKLGGVLVAIIVSIIVSVGLVLAYKQKFASKKEVGQSYESRDGYIQPIGKGQLQFMEFKDRGRIYGLWILVDSTGTPTDITIHPLTNIIWEDTLTPTKE